MNPASAIVDGPAHGEHLRVVETEGLVDVVARIGAIVLLFVEGVLGNAISLTAATKASASALVL